MRPEPNEARQPGRVFRARVTVNGLAPAAARVWKVQQRFYWNLAPPDWFESPPDASLFIRGYRTAGLRPADYREPVCFDLQLAVGALRTYSPVVLRAAADATTRDSELGITIITDVRRAARGTYLLVLTPFSIAGRPAESAARSRVDQAVGLVALLEGHNIIYEQAFEWQVPWSGLPTGWTPLFPNPIAHRVPTASAARISVWQDAARGLARIDDERRRRILLALNWVQKAATSAGQDAFLAYWIATEAIMEGSDMRPIVQRLAAVYELSRDEVASRFHVGRMYGLRGDIVHGAVRVPIHDNLLVYMDALAADLLFDLIGLPPERRLDAVLAREGFDLLGHLTALAAVPNS